MGIYTPEHYTLITDSDYYPLPEQKMKTDELIDALEKAGLREGGNWESQDAVGPISDAMTLDRDHFDDNFLDMLDMTEKEHEELYGLIVSAIGRVDALTLTGVNTTFAITLSHSYQWIGKLIVDTWIRNTFELVERDIDAYMEELGEYARGRAEAMAEDAAEARREFMMEDV